MYYYLVFLVQGRRGRLLFLSVDFDEESFFVILERRYKNIIVNLSKRDKNRDLKKGYNRRRDIIGYVDIDVLNAYIV